MSDPSLKMLAGLAVWTTAMTGVGIAGSCIALKMADEVSAAKCHVILVCGLEFSKDSAVVPGAQAAVSRVKVAAKSDRCVLEWRGADHWRRDWARRALGRVEKCPIS
jgi:hypothetical protein